MTEFQTNWQPSCDFEPSKFCFSIIYQLLSLCENLETSHFSTDDPIKQMDTDGSLSG